uniref:G-protein coupled receptors family 1 profile domain-containing protein n=1 Tax=Hippocampus comes TaxID=109280 RepID=A0A3Q2YDS0_HIPCM
FSPLINETDFNLNLCRCLPLLQERIDGFGVLMAILYLAVCIAGLAGNSLVIVAVLKLDKMSSATTVYIFNLALADGLFMVGLPFIASQNFLSRWLFGDAACKVVMVLDGINQFTSVFCLTVMSIDRYMALADPLRFASWRTPRCAKIVSAFLWLFSILAILPMALHFSADRGLCIPDLVSEMWWLGVLSYTFVLGFALPFTIMSASYTALLLTLRSQRLRATVADRENRRPERQVTKMVVAVVVVFALCWLPFYTVNFCSMYQSNPNFARVFEFLVLLSYSWSCANPILYTCLSETFRKHFRALLCSGAKSSPSMQCNTEQYDLNGDDVQTTPFLVMYNSTVLPSLIKTDRLISKGKTVRRFGRASSGSSSPSAFCTSPSRHTLRTGNSAIRDPLVRSCLFCKSATKPFFHLFKVSKSTEELTTREISLTAEEEEAECSGVSFIVDINGGASFSVAFFRDNNLTRMNA